MTDVAQQAQPQAAVSDQDLASAWDAQLIEGSEGEPMEAAPVKQGEQPAATPPKAENAESSRQGREIAELKRQVEQLTGLLQAAAAKPHEQEEDRPPDAVYDANGVIATMEWRDRQAQKAYQMYQTAYVQVLGGIKAEVGDEDFGEVFALMMDPKFPQFNAMNKLDPEVDAKDNYLRAKLFLDKHKKAGNVNLRQESGKGAAVASAGKGEATAKPVRPKLSREEEDFISAMGMTDEEVAKALGADRSSTLVIKGR